MAGPRSDKDGMVAKAAGLVVFGGVAWSLYKSVAPMIFLNSKVPQGQPYHIIQGDTLFSIARSNGVISNSFLLIPLYPSGGVLG